MWSLLLFLGGVKKVGVATFSNSSIRKVVLEDGVQFIGGGAFMGTKSLVDVSLPDSVDYIDSACFTGSAYDISEFVKDFTYNRFNNCYWREETLVSQVTRQYEFAKGLLDGVNAERTKVGLAALVPLTDYMDAAMIRSAECDFVYDHIRPIGGGAGTIIDGAGSENIASGGGGTPEDVINAWMESPLHRSAILGKYPKYIGVGATKNTDRGNHWNNYTLLFIDDNFVSSPVWSTEPDRVVNEKIAYTRYGLPMETSFKGVDDMKVGVSFEPIMIASPKNDTIARDYSLVTDWSSSNPNVVKVDGKSLVASRGGKSTITGTSGSTVLSKEITVTSAPVPITGISLNKKDLSLTQGASEKMPHNTTNADAIKWESSNSSIATVDTNGTVNAVSNGSVVITASCGGVTATCNVQVKAIVPVIDGNVIKGIIPDESCALLISGLKAGGFVQSNGTVGIYDKSGNLYSDSKLVETGMTVKINLNTPNEKVYQTMIRGDSTGDGKINTKDSSLIKDYSGGKINLEDVYKKAADTNNDGKVNMKDCALIRDYIAGIEEINFFD